MHIHRITGFSILALFLWKSRNILGSFRTRRNWKTHLETMLASSALLVGLLIVLGLGLAWSHFGSYSFLGFSGTTIHLNLALLLIPLLVWHSLRHKISFRMRYVADRRNVLRLGGLAVAGLALWQVTDRLNILADGPVADRRFTGSHPENGPDFPVTMWLRARQPRPADDRSTVPRWVPARPGRCLRPGPPPGTCGPYCGPGPCPPLSATQHIDGDQWRLRVNGHVERPYEMDLEELQSWNSRLTAILDCTGGWYTTREWQGVPVTELLARANVKPGAGSITIRSRTGYYRRYSMAEAERALLASRVDGAPLSPGHGFPARMVEPHKRGYDWVKWVDEITVNDTSKFWQPPLPVT